MNRLTILLATVMLASGGGCEAPASTIDLEEQTYRATYRLTPEPGDGSMLVSLRIEQAAPLLRNFRMPQLGNLQFVRADGRVETSSTQISWYPPETGGQIEWRVAVNHQRGEGGFDALLNEEFGVLRAEDVIPRARTRSLKGASSDTLLEFNLPPGWSAISEYSDLTAPIRVDRPDRRFDEPAGWLAFGKLGTRRETIAGSKIAVTAPEGQSARRMDAIALLNWTLPELDEMLNYLPPRLTIFIANDPMWRGGLSAPQSIYLHADRPLIGEDATSTLIHELMHVALRISARDGYDWIVEGLAEYYSLELLHRGGAITTRRYRRAIEALEEKGAAADSLCRPASKGATTALAVSVLRRLDKELRKRSKGDASLDLLTSRLRGQKEKVALRDLRRLAVEMIGEEPQALQKKHLPGC